MISLLLPVLLFPRLALSNPDALKVMTGLWGSNGLNHCTILAFDVRLDTAAMHDAFVPHVQMEVDDFTDRDVNVRATAKDALIQIQIDCLITLEDGIKSEGLTLRIEAVQAANDHAAIIFLGDDQDIKDTEKALGRRAFNTPIVVVSSNVRNVRTRLHYSQKLI